MVVKTEIFYPGEKRERALVIEWPDKETFLKERNRYFEEKLGDEVEKVKNIIGQGDEEELKWLARLILESEFVLRLMQEISPIQLEVPMRINISSDSDKEAFFITSAKLSDTRSLSEVVVNINLDSISKALEKIETTDNADRFEQVENLDIDIMQFAIHEFGHMLYMQEAVTKRSENKKIGLKISAWLKKNAQYFEKQDLDEKYLSLDIETRGRIWALDFLNKMFPESDVKKLVKKELEVGQLMRMKVSS